MDQASFEALLHQFQSRCATDDAIRELTVLPGPAAAPLVVLVHGIGGNARHWSDPAALDLNQTWLFNLDAPPPPAAPGLLLSAPYAPSAVTPWVPVLHNHQFTVITYSQSRPDDALQFAVTELSALLRQLEQTVFTPYAQAVAPTGGAVPPLIILCHSRGGLVTRGALKQLGAAGVPHLRKVITLNTPHQGSYMPRLAHDYNQRLQTAIDFRPLAQRLPGLIRGFFEQAIDRYVDTLANRVREALLHAFGPLAQGPGFEELIPGSAMLTALASGEQPLPNVQYLSFGGSNPVFVKFYVSELGHAVYLVSAVGSFLVERLAQLPGVATAYGGLAELLQGDSAVGLASSHWPDRFSGQHQELHYNHMQALVDPAVQQAVLPLLQN